MKHFIGNITLEAGAGQEFDFYIEDKATLEEIEAEAKKTALELVHIFFKEETE